VLGDELAEIEAEWRPRLAEVGRSLTVRCPRDTIVHATPGRLREAIGVLVENSLRHGAGQVGLTVRTATRGSGAMVVLEVSDEGPGVPEGLVAHVFDRGVSTASSTGIGLGLARAFIEADGGRLELRRAVPPIFAIFLAVGQTPAIVGSDQSATVGLPLRVDRPGPGPDDEVGATPAGIGSTGLPPTGPPTAATGPPTAASPAGR